MAKKQYANATAKCLGCGKTWTKPADWFVKNKMKRPDCGGKIDTDKLVDDLAEGIQLLINIRRRPK